VKKPAEDREEPFFFLFRENELLVKGDEDGTCIPRAGDLHEGDIRVKESMFLGMLDGISCYVGQVEDHDVNGAVTPQGKMFFSGLRPLLGQFEDELFRVAGTAFQVINWDRTHRYCGQCGDLMGLKSDERAKVCPRCGLVNFPRISPAIIIAIVKDERILLAKANRFPAGLYSVLAGFVEPGENLEECARREVREEVGIRIKDIKYFGSQPWPFPHSLMLGFTARYAGGALRIDPAEIAEAGWFAKDDLPKIPPFGTIARELIEWFLKETE
jgi:NAD+ diphosphatase